MKETVSDGAHEVRWGVDSRGKVQRTEKVQRTDMQKQLRIYTMCIETKRDVRRFFRTLPLLPAVLKTR